MIIRKNVKSRPQVADYDVSITVIWLLVLLYICKIGYILYIVVKKVIGKKEN